MNRTLPRPDMPGRQRRAGRLRRMIAAATVALAAAGATVPSALAPATAHAAQDTYRYVSTMYHFTDYVIMDTSSSSLYGKRTSQATLMAVSSTGAAPSTGTAWQPDGSSPYEAVYCADFMTGASGSYTRMPLSSSGTGLSADQQARLRAIMAHSYPFISVERMNAELRANPSTSRLSVTRHELVAATQWAIWDVTNPQPYYDAQVGGYRTNRSTLVQPVNAAMNPSLFPLGASDSNTFAVRYIRDYLLGLTDDTGADYAIAGATSSSETNADGTRDVTVTVTLNRALGSSDTLDATVDAGDGLAATQAFAAGQDSASVTLRSVPASASPVVRVEGTRSAAEAYFYKSTSRAQNLVNMHIVQQPVSLTATPVSDDASLSVTKTWNGLADGEWHPTSVQVQLTRNGEDYGAPVTLDEAGGWTHTWHDLPKTDAQGQPWRYAVSEQAVAGFTARSTPESIAPAEDEATAFTLTNTKTEVALIVAKVGAGERRPALEGARFDLYEITGDDDADATAIPGTERRGRRVVEGLTTESNGKAALDGLKADAGYAIVETDAPAGYRPLERAVTFRLGTDGVITLDDDVDGMADQLADGNGSPALDGGLPTLRIANHSAVELPATGGAGTGALTGGGVAMTMLGLGGLAAWRRRGRSVRSAASRGASPR